MNKMIKATIINLIFLSGFVIMTETIDLMSFIVGMVVIMIYWLTFTKEI